jgi:hypothetical protein
LGRHADLGGHLIKLSELRQAYLSGDGVSILRNGRWAWSTASPSTPPTSCRPASPAGLAAGETAIYAGHAHALTFASQFTKVETLRSEMTFGQILRGLQVYGYKVVDGTALAQAIVTKG